MRKFIKKTLKIHSKRQLINSIRISLLKTLYRRSFSTKDLITELQKLNIKSGDTLIVHSAWDSFFNYKEKPSDLIKGLEELVGENGNLIMPAYSIKNIYKSLTLDIEKDPTGAGLLAEIFRRFSSEIRTAEIHSVALKGPFKHKLSENLQLLDTPWGEMSSYSKLLKNKSKVICLGLEPWYLPTQYHCVEDLLFRKNDPYYKQFLKEKQNFSFFKENKLLFSTDYNVPESNFTRKQSRIRTLLILKKYFDRRYYRRYIFNGLSISYFDSNYLVKTLLSLHEKGITIYSKPRLK